MNPQRLLNPVGVDDDNRVVLGTGFWDHPKRRWRRAPPRGVYAPWWWGRYVWPPNVVVHHEPKGDEPGYTVMVAAGSVWKISHAKNGSDIQAAIVELLLRNHPRMSVKKAVRVSEHFPAGSVVDYGEALPTPYRSVSLTPYRNTNSVSVLKKRLLAL